MFARYSGYSPRLIRKAEASQSLDQETIEILAQTLTCAAFPVTCIDLISDPEVKARHFVEAYSRQEIRNPQYVQSILDPGIELRVAGREAGLPYADTFTGIAAFCEFWRKYFEIFRRPDPGCFQPVICSEMNQVIVSGDELIQSVTSPEPFATWLIFRLRITNDLVTHCDLLTDTGGIRNYLLNGE